MEKQKNIGNLQFLNEVNLVGKASSVRTSLAGGRTVARFSVVTEYGYIDKEGSPVIESTWHNCTAWERPGVRDIGSLKPGSTVRVTGRLRNIRFTDADGTERTYYEVLVNRMEVLTEEEAPGLELQPAPTP